MENNQLLVMVQKSDLPVSRAQTILQSFEGYFEIAAEWEAKAKEIAVTDASQTDMIELAGEGRKFLQEKRIAIEKSRKELKESALREGQCIDGIAKTLTALIKPIEDYLDKQEKFVKYKLEAEERRKLDEARAIMAEREQERIKKEMAEEEERQNALRIENEKLRAEQAEKNKIILQERAKAEQAQREAREAAEAARKEREESERKAREAQEKAEAEKKAIEDKARKEREAAIAKQREADAKARIEKEELERRLAAQVVCPACGNVFIPDNK